MDVSIVIVNYNVSALLNECLQSIKKETSFPYEIIVVDNNSQDDSLEVIKMYHPDVKLIENQRNIGFAKANNLAFLRARGRYIFMLNPDTVILDGAIDKLVSFMEKHPEASACGPKNLNPDLTLQHNCHHFPSISMAIVEYLQLKRFFPTHKIFGREHMTYWKYDDIRVVDWITGCSFMMRREILENMGYLDENYFMYAEECDLCYRIKKKKMKTVYFPQASIIHYGGQSSFTENYKKVHSKIIIEYLFKSRYYFFKKNYGREMEFLLRILDIIYFGFILLRNNLAFSKKSRLERIDLAKIILRVAIKYGKD
jgi:hypothetical protein